MMASTRLSYQRLKNPTIEGLGDWAGEADEVVVFRRRRSRRWWPRLRRWRRPRIRVAGLLRRKARLVGAAVRVSVGKVLRRLKEGRPLLGELFAGNYMFMQVSPSPTMAYLDKCSLPPRHHHHHHLTPLPSSRFNTLRAGFSSP